MFLFAQTNLQLMRQLRDQQYSQVDISRVNAAYDIAVPMFSGRFRGSGKPFIAHLVGTVSVLASRKVEIEMLLAALLHAAYTVGDLGFHPGRRQSAKQRAYIRQCVGSDAENLISLYDANPWSAEKIASDARDWKSMDLGQRNLVLMHLANTYEDFMDGAMAHGVSEKNSMYVSVELQGNILKLAELSEWPALGELQAMAFKEFNEALHSVNQTDDSKFSRLRLPPSAARRVIPAMEGWLARRLRKLFMPTDRRRL